MAEALAAGGGRFAPAGQRGVFAGYASLFGVPDSAGDVVVAGAFAASLARRGPGGIRMLFQHDASRPIGTWLELREDSRGLFVRGRLAAQVQQAEELGHLLHEGALDGLSIGFRAVLATRDRLTRQRRLMKIDLWEISLVTFPMLEGARVTALGWAPTAPLRKARTLGAALAVALAWSGHLLPVFQTDQSRLTLAIAALFLIGWGWCLKEVLIVSGSLNRSKRLGYRPAPAAQADKALLKVEWMETVSEWLVGLGLLGTVVGFSTAMSGIDQSSVMQAAGAQNAVAALMQGMRVALNTTLLGAALAIWHQVKLLTSGDYGSGAPALEPAGDYLLKLRDLGYPSVIAFQKHHPNLIDDGILGPATRAQIDRDIAARREGIGVATGVGIAAFLAHYGPLIAVAAIGLLIGAFALRRREEVLHWIKNRLD